MATKLKLLLDDEMSDPSKIFSAISVIKGITFMKFDADQRRLIIQGEMDPVKVMQKLKKWNYKLISFGPVGRRSRRQPQQQFQSSSPPPTPTAPPLLMPDDYAYPYPYLFQGYYP